MKKIVKLKEDEVSIEESENYPITVLFVEEEPWILKCVGHRYVWFNFSEYEYLCEADNVQDIIEEVLTYEDCEVLCFESFKEFVRWMYKKYVVEEVD